MIESFSLSEISGHKARTLSGGWQRRLSIAMALISNPRILFLDEPTLGLDVLARRELWNMIKRLKGSVTIVLTTHYLEEAEALPFVHAVDAAKATITGDYASILPQLLWVAGYAIIILVLAIAAFNSKMKSDNK